MLILNWMPKLIYDEVPLICTEWNSFFQTEKISTRTAGLFILSPACMFKGFPIDIV